MQKTVILRLDRFGQEALEEFLRDTGTSRDLAVRTAVAYYLGDSASGRVAWRVPELARSATFSRQVEIELDGELHRKLGEEARRQDVEPELLAAHALVYYLTDVDTGRVAARLGDAISRDAEAN
jgi:hypothetical protein